MRRTFATLSILSLILLVAATAAASLTVGNKAPSIKVTKWVKGNAVDKFDNGKTYVVEFWATWCGPCKASIPHLTELQKKNPDVTFMGIAASERSEGGKDNRLSKLETFVKSQGDQMSYRVGYAADETMYKAWMTAAGKTGIPCAFIVDGEGKVAWIGHPNELDTALDAALAKNPKGDKSDKKSGKDKSSGGKSKSGA